MGPKGKRNNVAYIKPEEPAFLRRIKEQLGYKEGPTVDTKRESLPGAEDDEDHSDRDEEKPTVVVLKTGDLTAKEADEESETLKKKEEEELIASGKITFKAPVKRSLTSAGSSEQKKSRNDEDENKTGGKDKSRKGKPASKSLLSFEEVDE